ncbi:tetratricopeptide repeat protein [Alteromonas sp. NFXS44]|uniref:tetratricopeptide repeat protein n=1 Tax=Alteromonas sp. NFXS44 TaxID=2818435 RepID=UPI0032DE9388
MSVINKMLRDLEGQNNQGGNTKNYKPSSSEDDGRKSRLIILGVLLLAAIAWSAFTFLVDAKDSGDRTAPPVKVVTSSDNQAGPAPLSLNTSSSPVSDESEPEPRLTASGDSSLTAIAPPDNTSVAVTNSSEPAPVTPENIPQAGVRTASQAGDNGPVIVFNQVQTESQSRQEEAVQITAPESAGNRVPVTKPEKAHSKTADTGVMKVTKSQPAAVEATLRDQIAGEMKKGNMREATRLLILLSQREPDNLDVRKKLASVYFAEGQVEQAQQILEQALVKAPANTSIRLMLGRLYTQQNLGELAWEVISQPVVTTDTDFLGFRAGYANQQQKYDTAINDYRALTELQPATARWWLGLGIAADKLDQRHLAVQAYQKALNRQGLEGDVEIFVRKRIKDLSE